MVDCSLTARWEDAVPALLSLAQNGIGASTGYMESDRGRWVELVQNASDVSDDAIELSALSASELPALTAFLADRPSLTFTYVSVHGPAKDAALAPASLAAFLETKLPRYVATIVMHPETLQDPESFDALGSRLVLENMDALKPDGRTVDELEPYFRRLPQAGFCFDIAHAYMNDPSMGLAHALLDAYGSRLREVHLSSILDDGTHVPLRAADARLFWPVLSRCGHVPWILEAELPA